MLPMRLGHLTDCYLPVLNGITTFVRVCRRAGEQAGVETYVFTSGHLGYPDAEPRVLRAPGLPLGRTGYAAYWRYPPAMLAQARRLDVLHAHHPFMALGQGAALRRQTGQPLVFTAHTRYDLYADHYLPFLPTRLARALMAALLRRVTRPVDLIIAVSAATETMLKAQGVTAPIEIIPNGIELERFTAAAPAGRAALGLPLDDFLALYVGRLGPEKNLPLLLDAFADAVQQSTAPLSLALVGSGALEADLRRQTDRLGLSGRVHFLGQQPNEAIPGLVATADAFITASLTEGHPITVIEALAAGQPVVALAVPGLRETITDGYNGLLAPPDPAALGAALARLAAASDLRAALRAGARASAAQYSITATTQRLIARYTDLLAATAARRAARVA
jgi:glycosyltransferase involved in cell wall biosynthesis